MSGKKNPQILNAYINKLMPKKHGNIRNGGRRASEIVGVKK